MTKLLKSFKKAIISERITKFNDIHDELGRFAEKGNGKSYTSKRDEVLAMDDSDKAVYMMREGAVPEDEMLRRFKAGETDRAVNEYFDIMDKNGDPTPTKETSGQIKLPSDTSDWEGARLEKLSELTGFDGTKATETRRSIKKYTSGAQITESEKRAIDEYIDNAPAYDGKMYRGMSFGDDYDDFKKRFSKGESFSLDGQISSWSDNQEDARRFAHTSDDGCSSVLLTCVKNRTSTPIDYLNGQGEGEVLASSKAQWTVLHQEEVTTNDGHKKLFVTCVEKGEKVAKSFLEIITITKVNPYHDEFGKFCSEDQSDTTATNNEKNSEANISQKELGELWKEQMEHLMDDVASGFDLKLAKKFTKQKATRENFFMNSIAEWEEKKSAPRREPDNISYDKRTGKVSSRYWYTDKGVYRKSNHWGSDVASCSWYLKGERYRTEGVRVNNVRVGFAPWDEIYAKGCIVKNRDTGKYSLNGFSFDKVAKSFIEIIMKKGNPYHDKLGRFTTADQARCSTDLSKYGKMIRTKPAPKKTMKAYKLFAIKDDGKLYPPMVANPGGVDTPTGVWVDAQAAQVVSQTKTGKQHVKAGGKGTGKGSGGDTVTLRPGWHCADLPIARQFGKKKTPVKSMPKNYVFAEVEIGIDKNYQEEAQKDAYSKEGKVVENRIGMLTIPEDGYYKMNTNQIERGTREWYICGTMKVGKIITDKEMNEVLLDAGTQPMPRVGGELTKEKLIEMGVDPSIIKDYK